jgi:REP element-mobilizing transposase RayT
MPYLKLYYHIVWTTWKREPMLASGNCRAIYSAIREKTEKLNGIVFALNGMEDHVHLVTTMPATLSLAEFVRQIKGFSAYIATHLPDHDPVFQWQSEYGALTVSETHLESVVAYVDRQQEHHAAGTLHPKLEHFVSDNP